MGEAVANSVLEEASEELTIVFGRWDGPKRNLEWIEGFVSARDEADRLVESGEADWAKVRRKGKVIYLKRSL